MELEKLKELANDLRELMSLMRSGITLYLEEKGDIVLSDEEMEKMLDDDDDVRVTITDEDGDGRTITIKGVKLINLQSIGEDIVVLTDEGDEVDGYGLEIYYWIIQFFSRVEKLRNN